MATNAKQLSPSFVHTGPSQHLNRAGIIRKAGDYIAPWGWRALISGSKKALVASEGRS
jgi:hypothetical protein